MSTIDYLHAISAIIFFIAAVHKLAKRQTEHFYTRIVACCWYILTVVFHENLPVEVVRIISNSIILSIPLTEIVSPLLMKYWKAK